MVRSLITRDDWQQFLTMCSPHVLGFNFDADSPGVILVTVYLERAYFEAHADKYIAHLTEVTKRLTPIMYRVEIHAMPVIENTMISAGVTGSDAIKAVQLLHNLTFNNPFITD